MPPPELPEPYKKETIINFTRCRCTLLAIYALIENAKVIRDTWMIKEISYLEKDIITTCTVTTDIIIKDSTRIFQYESWDPYTSTCTCTCMYVLADVHVLVSFQKNE